MLTRQPKYSFSGSVVRLNLQGLNFNRFSILIFVKFFIGFCIDLCGVVSGKSRVGIHNSYAIIYRVAVDHNILKPANTSDLPLVGGVIK